MHIAHTYCSLSTLPSFTNPFSKSLPSHSVTPHFLIQFQKFAVNSQIHFMTILRNGLIEPRYIVKWRHGGFIEDSVRQMSKASTEKLLKQVYNKATWEPGEAKVDIKAWSTCSVNLTGSVMASRGLQRSVGRCSGARGSSLPRTENARRGLLAEQRQCGVTERTGGGNPLPPCHSNNWECQAVWSPQALDTPPRSGSKTATRESDTGMLTWRARDERVLSGSYGTQSG